MNQSAALTFSSFLCTDCVSSMINGEHAGEMHMKLFMVVGGCDGGGGEGYSSKESERFAVRCMSSNCLYCFGASYMILKDCVDVVRPIWEIQKIGS